MLCHILFHWLTCGISALFLWATLAVVYTQTLPFWLVRSYSDLIKWSLCMRRLWISFWSVFLSHCGTTHGISPNNRIEDGQRRGKTEQMEEGRTKENEHVQGDKVCLGQKKFMWKIRESGIYLFIFCGYFGNTRVLKVDFWTFTLESFCTFCRSLSYIFAFCSFSSLKMNIDYQGNFFNYFIHTFYVNYSLFHCEGSCPHVSTYVSVWKLSV